MQVALQLKGNSKEERRLDAVAPMVRIGRHPECDIRIDGPQSDLASNVHARIFLRGGEAFLEDMQSSNGTFLNGIAIKKAVAVQVGDAIRLGQDGPLLEVLVLVINDPVASAHVVEPIRAHRQQVEPLAKVIKSDREVPPVPQEPKPPHRHPSRTTELLHSVMEEHNRLKSSMLSYGVIALLMVIGVVSWVQMNQPTSQALQQQRLVTGNDAYLRLMKCAILVTKGMQTDAAGNKGYFVGSGVIVEVNGKMLGLTNSHVVGGNSEVDVHFPLYENGALVTDQQTIVTSGNGIKAKVIANNSKKDCAILELDEVSADCQPLSLADVPAEPGQRIHSVGHPGVVNSAWVYTTGTVKHREFNTINFDKNKYVGWVIYAQYPINQGDSGGAMMNDAFELIGLNMGHADGPQLISYGVSLEEIKAVLQSL